MHMPRPMFVSNTNKLMYVTMRKPNNRRLRTITLCTEWMFWHRSRRQYDCQNMFKCMCFCKYSNYFGNTFEVYSKLFLQHSSRFAVCLNPKISKTVTVYYFQKNMIIIKIYIYKYINGT